jgi:hypothetical protein
MMFRLIYAPVAAVAAVALSAMGAQAVPSASAPAADHAAVHKTQGFGIYIGPGYDGYYGRRYRYADPYYYDGYRPYYSRNYYDGPRYYYPNRYRGDRRTFRRLQRSAP